MTTALAQPEVARLKELEATIERGVATFVEVGKALLTIRDDRLYRDSHKTFEAYCRERWAMTRQHANRLIGSARVAADLEPIGSKPTSEGQARSLAKLPPEDRPAAWEEASRKAGAEGRKPSARDVEAAVEEQQRPGHAFDISEHWNVPQTGGEDYSADSEILYQLKRFWKRATKKDRGLFGGWIAEPRQRGINPRAQWFAQLCELIAKAHRITSKHHVQWSFDDLRLAVKGAHEIAQKHLKRAPPKGKE